MRKRPGRNRNTARNTKKHEKMRNAYYKNWNMARKLTKRKMRKSWQDMEYGEKHGKTCKMRNTHCRTWKKAINSEKKT